jgi:hypothetical protein
MELHHDKHHRTYVTNLNNALTQYAEAEAKQDLQKMISLQGAINFNGGGEPGWQAGCPRGKQECSAAAGASRARHHFILWGLRESSMWEELQAYALTRVWHLPGCASVCCCALLCLTFAPHLNP